MISVIKKARTMSSSKNGFKRKYGIAANPGWAKKALAEGLLAAVPQKGVL
jgi:hypothetical protein